VFAASVSYVSVGAQGPTSVLGGVYTEEQAKRGAPIYAEQCAACHGETLTGSDPIPALAGADFQTHYKNVGELFDKISASMPAMAPGSLTGAQVAEVVAYMLSVNKYPAGTTALADKAEQLAQIKIEPSK
jgi:quinoprotein glucose dehydrogenase